MELRCELDGAGWATACISHDGRHCDFAISFLSDALGDMATAAVLMLNGAREAMFCFQDEPGEHRFILTRGPADALTIRVLHFDDTFSGRADRFGREIFCFTGAVLDFVGPVSSILHTILRAHGTENYREKWRHDFPSRTYAEIHARLHPDDAA